MYECRKRSANDNETSKDYVAQVLYQCTLVYWTWTRFKWATKNVQIYYLEEII